MNESQSFNDSVRAGTPLRRSTHTPGPWDIAGNLIQSRYGEPVAMISRQLGHRIEHPRREANARLIAAAPELLATLKNALEYFDSPIGAVEAADVAARVEAAIAKAEYR